MKTRKVIVNHYGGPEVLEVREVQLAEPKPDEVLIKVLASAVSGADVNMRQGSYPMQKKAPIQLGYSIVGEVVAVGSDVTNCKKGNRVASLTIYDGFGDYSLALGKHCVAVPPQAPVDQCVCLVLDGMTAYQMLTRKANLKSGSRIFVHGVSGAVGSALALLAKTRGIEVWGTASSKKHADLKTSLGVTRVFDYRDTSFVSRVFQSGGVDAVFDPLGYDSFMQSFRMLKSGGTVVGYGFNGNLHNGKKGNIFVEMIKFLALNLNFQRKRAIFYGISRDSAHFAKDLEYLAGEVMKKQFVPAIKKSFRLDQIREAHQYWGSGDGIGSIVVIP